MSNPFFWLGLSLLLVAVSLMALLTVAIFALQELARAARSAEKLLDNLNRELPATLQDLRLTGKDISTLSDEVSGSMQSARSVVQQVDQGLLGAKTQAKQAKMTTRSLIAGTSAALRVLMGGQRRRRRPPTRRPPVSSKSSSHDVKASTERSVTEHSVTEHSVTEHSVTERNAKLSKGDIYSDDRHSPEDLVEDLVDKSLVDKRSHTESAVSHKSGNKSDKNMEP